MVPGWHCPRGFAQAAGWWLGFWLGFWRKVLERAQRLPAVAAAAPGSADDAGASGAVSGATPPPESGAAPSLVSTSPGGSGTEVDPALLLTAEEVSAAFGRKFGPPRPVTSDRALPYLGVRMCEYVADGPDRAKVQVQAVTGRIARALLDRVRGEPLPGVGEHALVRGGALAMVQGDVGLAIYVQHVEAATARAGLRQLAVIAASRLPHDPLPHWSRDPAG